MRKLFLLPFIFFCSCVTINTKVDSSAEANSKANVYPFFDQGLKVHYQISNDNKILHIRLNTTDYALINKIVNTGLRVCFDVKGKKHDKVFVEYPLVRKQVFSDRILQRTFAEQRAKMTLNKLLEEIPDEAIFKNHGDSLHFAVSSNKTDIQVSITARRNNAISYDLIIPIKRISPYGIAGLSNLSIGFVTAETNLPNIATSFPDISGSDARGDVAIYDRNGARVSNGNTFGTSGGGGTFGSGNRQATTRNNARIAPVDRFNRRGRYATEKQTDVWFKVVLKTV